METHNGKSYNPPGQKPISIDGNFGPQTNTYIKFFAAEDNRINPGNPVSMDNKIEPMSPSSGGQGSISGKIYKIAALNFIYLQRRGLNGHNDISNDPLYPVALNPSLYV